MDLRNRAGRAVAAVAVVAGSLLAAGGHPAGASQVASSSDWLGEINGYRTASGLGPVADNPAWDQGIANHLVYLARTPPAEISGQYASLHTENPASPFYTPSGAQEAGASDLYPTGAKDTPVGFIDGWLTAPFHAIGMLRAQLRQVAFDTDPTYGGAGLDVISGLDQSAPAATAPILFPGPNSSTDLYSYGGESPDPLETCGWQNLTSPVGLGLIMLLPSSPAAGLSATLTGPGGSTASSAGGGLCVVDENTYHSSDQVYGPTGLAILQSDHAVILFPRTPLQAGAYTVSVDQAGQAPITWSFTETHTSPPVCSTTLPAGTVVGMAGTPDGNGYWIASSTGQVAACGDAPALGDAGTTDSPVTAITAAPSGTGYWLVTARGSVYSFGSAGYAGGIPAGVTLDSPIVAMAADPATGGYWLLGGDGGVFAYNAPFYGSTGGIHLDQPAVGMEATPDGTGYRFVARDGGIFDYGSARFFGSTGGIHLNQPVVGMAVDPATGGYWLDAADGGIFSFNAPFYGSTGNIALNQPCVGLTATPDGGGYRFVAADGGIFDFGDAGFAGSAAG